MNSMKILLVIVGSLALCQAGNYDYGDVIQKSLLFYEAQRSGKLPADQKVTWRKDSALNDRGENGEDLTGGYYDAGDFVKFGFPMAFTTTVLSWGIISNKEGYVKAGALEDARKAVKWATDYFVKCHVSENVFYGQVGNADADHAYWGRPEDMTMERPAYKIDSQHPGTELAAETAAALAAASIVFESVDSSYSKTLIKHAEQLYSFAQNHLGKYSDSITNAQEFYKSWGYEDELVWGAAWLYKATGDNNYLSKAQQYYHQHGLAYGDGYFNWDNKVTAAELLLAQLTNDNTYEERVKSYCNRMLFSQQRTPKGLVYIDMWGTLRHAANAAFLCLEAAKSGMNTEEYRKFAINQIGYMLGDTGRSFVVGYGTNPPTREHHRASSCPDAPAVCNWDTYYSEEPNAHVLYGALVGGPDSNDNYQDARTDYVQNEVACDYNAGFQGALAALNEL